MYTGQFYGAGPVASLRLVSPGAVTDGVTFFNLKSYDLFVFFSRRPQN